MSASTGKKTNSGPAAGTMGAEPVNSATTAPPARAGSAAVLAEPGQRLVARLIDSLIVGPPVALVARALLPEPAYGVRPAETATAIGVAVLYLLYDAVQHALWGRTIGKRLTGIQAVSTAAPDAHGRVGLPRALLRAAVFALPIAARPVPVLGIIAGLFWVANAAWVLDSTRRRALHDRIAATAVVRTLPEAAPGPTFAP
jgi:uncharacterized RDD family membrane protein YckC